MIQLADSQVIRLIRVISHPRQRAIYEGNERFAECPLCCVAVLSTTKAWNLDGDSLSGVARGDLGGGARRLGLLRQGCSVFGAP